MATPFDPMKIPIIYLNSLTPKTLLFMQKNLNILYRTEICATLAYFYLFGFHGNALCSLKNSDSIFKFYNHEILSYTQKLSLYRVQN